MKRIIFSIWNDFNDNHPLKKYKDKLIKKHKEYAKICECNYRSYTITKKHVNLDFTQLQFMKLYMLEEHLHKWDEVLYLDLDVIPQTRDNFFEVHDLNNICCHMTVAPRWKILQKNLMLSEIGIKGKYHVANTGVIGLNKRSGKILNFMERQREIRKYYIDDFNIVPNNEVYLSYIMEKYNVPYKDIGMGWNFILDSVEKKPTAGCHFLHVSNKNFSLVL